MNNLGGMYEMGWERAPTRRRAVELYTRAAELGNQLAVDNLRRIGAPVSGGKGSHGFGARH